MSLKDDLKFVLMGMINVLVCFFFSLLVCLLHFYRLFCTEEPSRLDIYAKNAQQLLGLVVAIVGVVLRKPTYRVRGFLVEPILIVIIAVVTMWIGWSTTPSNFSRTTVTAVELVLSIISSIYLIVTWINDADAKEKSN
jgi:hypothetical protein